ncbi:MAG TPA: nitroreductase family protein [Polyangiaceae bacterium]|nr:nitroreductase family protein [Polyangiaceae bacterium]
MTTVLLTHTRGTPPTLPITRTRCSAAKHSSNYPNPASLSTLMRGRRSVRVYRDEPVDKALIENMLEVVRWAPSGKIVQPLRFVVTSGKQRMHELVEPRPRPLASSPGPRRGRGRSSNPDAGQTEV